MPDRQAVLSTIELFQGPVVLAIAWVITLAALFASLEPLLLVGLMIAFNVLAALYLLGTGKLIWPDGDDLPLFAALLAFAAYVLTSSLWSGSPQTALGKGLLVILLILSVRFARLLFDLTTPLQLHRSARGIMAGLLIGLIFPVIEYLTDHSILSFVAGVFPGLVSTVGETTQIPDYHNNANMTAIILFFWPTLLVAGSWKNKQTKSLFTVVLLAAILLLLFWTHSATAQAAFVLGCVAFGFARFAQAKVDLIARILWTMIVVGIIPIIMAVHFVGVQNLANLPFSFRDRIHIWNYTAHQTLKNPLLGIGVRTSRKDYSERKPDFVPTKPGQTIDRPGWHSHNMFLQTWYNLGAAGALLLLIAGLFILSAIRNQSLHFRPFAYATFASVCLVAAVGYGMWQSWLLSCFAWSTVFLMIGQRYSEKMDEQKTVK